LQRLDKTIEEGEEIVKMGQNLLATLVEEN
jgi:hypothetical protein